MYIPVKWRNFKIDWSKKDDCFEIKNPIQKFIKTNLLIPCERWHLNKNSYSYNHVKHLTNRIRRTKKFRTIIVRPIRNSDKFKILNGHHRASIVAKLWKWKHIPVTIVKHGHWLSY